MSDFVKNYQVFAMTTDPVYIGTGGYTIGRVDNTIVRDPITKVPKIPGSSLAGVWRYYAVLEILNKIKDKKPKREDILKRSGGTIKDKIDNWIKYTKDNTKDNNGEDKDKDNNGEDTNGKWDTSKWYFFKGNALLEINCAGQDNTPQEELSNIVVKNKEGRTGHCGHCLVCKGFGFSKKDISWQGMIYFSDLNILFFPVFTMYGTRWITTDKILKMLNLYTDDNDTEICIVLEKIEEKRENGYINLGWIYLPYKVENRSIDLNKFSEFGLNLQDIVIVPDNLFSQIVNSNLEIRTSVSIDPITGAAKEGALFTSEAIPRGTILYGNIRIFDKKSFVGIDNKLEPLPSIDELECALKESKHFFETLGIGGMTTRGFGRLKIKFNEDLEKKDCKSQDKLKQEPGGQ